MVTLHRLLYVTQLHFYYTILAVCSPSQYCPAFFWLKSRSFTLKLIGNLIKSLRLHRLLYLNCRMCTNRTSPRMSKIRMLPSQPTLVFVGITGLEPAPLFLTPVPKTGLIPITDYIPSLLCRRRESNPQSLIFVRKIYSLLSSPPAQLRLFKI